MIKVVSPLFMYIMLSYILSEAAWEPDRRLTFENSPSWLSFNNAWCLSAKGDSLHVVWEDFRSGGPEIFYKRSVDGGTTWSSDTSLTSPDNYASEYPSVASSGSDVHVVWMDRRDQLSEIYYKRSSDGGTSWGLDTRLSSDSLMSMRPSMAAWNALVQVVWFDSRDGNWEIYHKRSSDGGLSWSIDTRLTNDTAISIFPSIAVSGLNTHLVWLDEHNGISEIYYKRSTDGGMTWGLDTRLTYDPADSYFPAVAVTDFMVHVLWHDYRNGTTNSEVYYKRSTDGGTTWGPDTGLTNDPSVSARPSLAVSGPNVHAVWYDGRDGNSEIYYKFSSNLGVSWGLDTRLTTDTLLSRYPFIAVSGPKVHVIWQEERDGNPEIYYKRNPSGNIGIEYNEKVSVSGADFSLKIIPNPFVGFTTIPGHEAERFLIYDVSGKLVGSYPGKRIGEDAPPGVYFVRPSNRRHFKVMRIVKVR